MRRALVREVTTNPMVTRIRASEVFCRDREKKHKWNCGQNYKCYVWWTLGSANYLANAIPPVNHDGVNIALGEFFSVAWIGRLVKIEGRIDAAGYNKVLEEKLLQTDVTWDCDEDSPFNMTMTQSIHPKQVGKVSDCPWVAQPKPILKPNRTSVGRPENCSSQTLPIKSTWVWEDLPGRMR